MADIGSLVVEVTTSNAMLPIAGAGVYMTSEDDSRLWAYRTTDNSGKTPIIEVQTPNSEESEFPDNTQQPFTSVNVYVSDPGYFNVVIRGVQIFGGMESIQQIQLVPIPENFQGDTTRIINVTPQNL